MLLTDPALSGIAPYRASSRACAEVVRASKRCAVLVSSGTEEIRPEDEDMDDDEEEDEDGEETTDDASLAGLHVWRF